MATTLTGFWFHALLRDEISFWIGNDIDSGSLLSSVFGDWCRSGRDAIDARWGGLRLFNLTSLACVDLDLQEELAAALKNFSIDLKDPINDLDVLFQVFMCHLSYSLGSWDG